MEKTVQNLLQCLRNVICGEDVPLIAMSETEQEKFYQMSLAQDMAHLISAAVGNGENHIISEKYRKRFRQQENLTSCTHIPFFLHASRYTPGKILPSARL